MYLLGADDDGIGVSGGHGDKDADGNNDDQRKLVRLLVVAGKTTCLCPVQRYDGKGTNKRYR